MLRIPSVKTLTEAFKLTPEQAKELRRALENEPVQKAMSKADELLGGYGIEFIHRGHNLKSPWIEYVNQGDPYTTTLMRVGPNGNYTVGCWGNYVERGNYD